MPITLAYRSTPLDPNIPNISDGYQDDEDYGDACSILVPVDVAGLKSLRSVTSAGIELREDFAPEWRPDVTYGARDRCYVYATHKVYESAQDNNINKDPSQYLNRTNAAGVATWWFEVGPTNRYAMFDGLVSSQTSAPSPLSITLTPGSFNGFAFFGLEADSVSVEVRDMPGGTIIYSETDTPLEGTAPEDYYEYFFDRFKPLKQFIRSGLEPYEDSEITVTFFKGSGDVKVGMFALGDLKPIGIPQRGASVDLTDFSYVTQDQFGNATVKKRPNASNLTISTKMHEDDVNSVLDIIREVQGVPVVAVGSQAEKYEWLTVFGLISGQPVADSYPYATLNIKVKGFI